MSDNFESCVSDSCKLNNAPKLYMIEFLRVLFLFCIIYFHSFVSYYHNQEHDMSVYKLILAVEYFFIIGGFFLYNNIMRGDDSFQLVKKIYFRLMPPLLFVFILCHIFSVYERMSLSNFPLVLLLVNGLSIFPDHIPGWGDWFIGVYFWASCLYIVLLSTKTKQSFLYVLVLVYVSIIYRTSMKSGMHYLTVLPVFIGHELFRGISSMGFGIVSSFISSKLGSVRNTIFARLVFTFIEIFCLVQLYLSLFVSYQTYYIKAFSIFGMLMISASHSLGYISAFFNKQSWISVLSKYAYSIFVMNMLLIRILEERRYSLSLVSYMCMFIGGCVVFGILEYHFIEKKLFPFLKKKIFA